MSEENERLALPAPDTSEHPTLEVNGGSVSLDHLGPMVVNSDGTLSRINNWEGLSQIEKDKTLRLIVKRNRQRLESLKQQEDNK
ncbi:hypothetical protein WALSEDRAFT_63343 [Wallemia mellicola CBS 633.66]|uniref:Uncharacterized protein n=2 Tax=Wallemia mellicola TaxID=1708541 RepID=A0A4T0PAZ6_9BASI|nr:hypothetical protein WALSEDRAFT_63343 [Wallemia mellicola CBS 633.66]TIB71342.1 hypothetical protein E3Q24_02367 [Wallemia mellicola]EIM22714.1 hypothetical protein WALSEDRAFT_63343 [Wallemia mellicola CBS 633.66]TIB75044.1 hypothetical protein E3Q23_02453 [Wallemia mellicola]TIB83714.1 hypothetical protein E3Q21_02725 [Wallemia mellicola]TIB86712.1 hypothetical protein E3Q20_02717 [Wallemia mellicola]|eukprot:XP_006957375.1 hypothetical protein WALSEDRAFT_63343 [Wallemia mellicola CBS 633.66]